MKGLQKLVGKTGLTAIAAGIVCVSSFATAFSTTSTVAQGGPVVTDGSGCNDGNGFTWGCTDFGNNTLVACYTHWETCSAGGVSHLEWSVFTDPLDWQGGFCGTPAMDPTALAMGLYDCAGCNDSRPTCESYCGTLGPGPVGSCCYQEN